MGDAEAIGAVGDPVASIVDAAREHDVDLIVVGGDEVGFIGRLLDHSVARALLATPGARSWSCRRPCPGCVLPRADEPRQRRRLSACRPRAGAVSWRSARAAGAGPDELSTTPARATGPVSSPMTLFGTPNPMSHPHSMTRTKQVNITGPSPKFPRD